jgi:hypothetical protein
MPRGAWLHAPIEEAREARQGGLAGKPLRFTRHPPLDPEGTLSQRWALEWPRGSPMGATGDAHPPTPCRAVHPGHCSAPGPRAIAPRLPGSMQERHTAGPVMPWFQEDPVVALLVCDGVPPLRCRPAARLRLRRCRIADRVRLGPALSGALQTWPHARMSIGRRDVCSDVAPRTPILGTSGGGRVAPRSQTGAFTGCPKWPD